MPESEPSAVSYESLSELLTPLQIILDPAELHGILCGKFCGGATPSETDWLLEAVEELDFTQPPDGAVRAALSALFQQTREQMAQQEFELQLLVPSDDDEIGHRVSCLSRWCQGFLVGFGGAGKVGEAELSPQAKEALEDLAAIGLVGLDRDDAEAMQAAENDYMEVLEYVRMAASALFMEFGAARVATTDDEPPSTVH
ncbi:UPF0149 family protein [Marinimicrobium sp. ABcell2]|uniref:UPF0149 family protein n=1 Tax=Marinimicrobium sp. ABcell2 TaxID=3069751 RepID=UPI0027B42487|nr:UPF0149 family protein [Marinimicrobium sp. ABcell2]MDQ2076140.1 UPF0149 family protein [Marinimicrobium sp. ABcell2]